MTRAEWEAWKERHAGVWYFVTTPILLLIMLVLVVWKWVLRCR